MTQSGWRKPTPGLGIAEQFAQAGERVAVPKSRAFVAMKRVGAHIGLKAGDMLLIDTLGAFTQAQDWEEGQRPIVWASNAYLMEQTGFSLSALKRHARRLAEFGVISFKDSPNGKRWGHRDPDGRIIEAYGFDLSPLSARVEEFEQLQAELQAERELSQRLKRQITVARRMIRARIEAALSGALRGPWEHFSGLFDDLLDQLPRRNTASEALSRLLRWFRELQERVEATYLKAVRADEVVENTAEYVEQVDEKTQEMNPREVISDPHILITNQLNPVICNSSEKEEAETVVPNAPPEERVDRELEDWVAETRKKRGAALDLATVMQACPEFAILGAQYGWVSQGLGRSSSGCGAAQADDRRLRACLESCSGPTWVTNRDSGTGSDLRQALCRVKWRLQADICVASSKKPGQGSCIWNAVSMAGLVGKRPD